MTYPVAAVANALIEIAADRGMYLSNLKLQKLVYFAHGWYLALHNTPLINEPVQSWRYGPVIPELYNELRHYGSAPVTKRIDIKETVIRGGEDYNFLEQIFAKYGMFSPAELIALTHRAGSPWEQFGAGQNWFEVIPNDAIRRDFLNKASGAN